MNMRKAEMSDLPELSQLFNAYRVFYKKISDIPSAQEFLKDRMANNESVIYVAENESKELIGFAQLYPLFSSTRMKRLWLLNDLYIDKRYRGQGTGIMFIECAKDLCRKTKACGLILETEKSNVEGNHLYPKTGFVLNSEYNHYSWDVD